MRTVDDSIIWIGDRSAELPVPQPSMTNIVDSLSAAARQVMRELVSDAKTAARKVSADHHTP
jgi:hypothetical protein